MKQFKLVLDIFDDENKILESCQESDPLVFNQGLGNLPKYFEDKIIDLQLGESFDILLTPDNGYGEIKKDLIQKISKSILPGKIDYIVGQKIELPTDLGPIVGEIVEQDNQHFLFNSNHPFAGKNIRFCGKVIEINEILNESCCDNGLKSSCNNCFCKK